MNSKQEAVLESWQLWVETGAMAKVQSDFGLINDEQYQTFQAGWLIGFYHALTIGQLLQKADALTQNN